MRSLPGSAVRWAASAALCVATAASAQSETPALTDEARVRCATRVSIALTGKAATPELLALPDARGEVNALLDSPEFIERFARFVNSRFNDEPGAAAEEDAAYYLAREVLTRKLPWKELFVGRWRVEKDGSGARAVVDMNGLGYFRSPAWLRRYAGNEEAGYKLSTAYRIMNNVVGLQLVAATNAPDVDISTEGRKAQACSGCHYEGPFALDKVARVLSKRVGEGDEMAFTPPDEGPQEILGGLVISDDKALVDALVESEDFRFNTCRMVFRYLYGRAEHSCEGPVFDRCMTEFQRIGTIQSAIAAVAQDQSFCQ